MPPSRSRQDLRRLRRALMEVLGVAVASSCALIALGHLLGGAKRSLVLWDGDSVLLPLLVRSIERGEPFRWGMSPVLFAFPELPLYLVSALVTSGAAAALLLNGVLNVVLLYAAFRLVAGQVASGARAVVAALAGVVALTVAVLLESRPGGNTGEVASLLLTTTYYAGTLIAVVTSIGLVLAVARRQGRRIVPLVSLLGVVVALSTWSNPLFVLWFSAPAGLALMVLAAIRRRILRPVALAAVTVLVASIAGYAGRLPLGRYLIAQKDDYFRWDGQGAALRLLGSTLTTLAETPGGAVELAGIAALLVVTVVVAVRAVVRREPDPRLAVGLIGVATLVVVPAVLIAVGNVSTRYALVLLVTPLTLLVVAVAGVPVRRRAASGRGARSQTVGSVAVGLAATLVVAGGASAGTRVVASGADPGVPGAACLADWTRDVDVAGAGQFWTIRGLAAAVPSAELIQVNSDATVYPWLANLAPAETARVGYLLVATGLDENGHGDYWGDTVSRLGHPRDSVDCGTFRILDYRGTAAEATLTDTVRASALAQAALRGFGATP